MKRSSEYCLIIFIDDIYDRGGFSGRDSSFSNNKFQENPAFMNSPIKGASPASGRLKGNFGKPLGRRAGSSGLSQAGKYIAQGNSFSNDPYRSPVNQSNSLSMQDQHRLGIEVIIIYRPISKCE
jgi:hypothetical protein